MQVLAVVAALHGDRAAEHVREQQHEHQRLQGDVEQLLGDLADVLDVAAGEHQGVATSVRDAATATGGSTGGDAAIVAGAMVVVMRGLVVVVVAVMRDVVDARVGDR